MSESDRYDRQQRIQGWRQSVLGEARVVIAGAGALGNEIIKNLALSGIGRILIIDVDHVELSNLSRSVLFRSDDIGKSKAMTAAEMATQLNPDIHVRYIHGNLFHDVGLGIFRHADLVIGALDSISVRSHVGCCCALAGKPFLDTGMWAFGGEVRWFVPDNGACFDCMLSAEDRKQAYERRSCSGFDLKNSDDPPLPSTVSTTAAIGAIAAQEAVKFLSGWQIHPSEAIVYNGDALTLHRSEIRRNPQCFNHSQYENVNEIQNRADSITAQELISLAKEEIGKGVILELGRDFLLEFYCKFCHSCQPINQLLAKIMISERRCPSCGNERKPVTISHVEVHDRHAERYLKDLGVPPGEILAVRTREQISLYELTADVSEIWRSK